MGVNFLLATVGTQSSKPSPFIKGLLHTMFVRPQQLTGDVKSPVQYTGGRGRSQILKGLEIEDLSSILTFL